MSCPLSSLVNPLNPKQVLLFYLSGNQSPALELQDVGADKTTATAFADNLSAPVDSKIVNPGSFSALYNENLLNLYGLVQSGPAQKGTTTVDAIAPKRLAQLSPVYKLLLPDSPTNTVIGVAMTTIVVEGQGYMYCMTGTEEKPRITEFSIGWSSSSRGEDLITKPLDTKPPLVASNLAAVFDPVTNKKLIVYQNEDNLRIVESTSENDAVIPNTDDSRDCTGLALVPVATDKGVKLYLYYFMQKGGKLQRVIRREDGTWGDSAAAGDKAVSDPNTFLSACQVGGVIMVYYIAKGESSIHSFRDKI
ncbi:hypothetical protein QBC41DRAFT_374864 [Cercophora samala]|uniref:Fucose-specific lectin n=1 Tax=Cercophora samala TaxID=330535 RepID=A0AA39ZBC8_9PEZI|nr:hypothetical protein QBC41DRAFT_374864 [Cercophora samala]